MTHESSEQNYLEKLKATIAGAPAYIEEVFNGESDNSWFAAVNSALTTISLDLEFAIESGDISTADGDRAYENLKSLAAEVKSLQASYPEKADQVPPEIKQAVVDSLNILE
jgi:hypothetical protein